jgi:hypothetical protein
MIKEIFLDENLSEYVADALNLLDKGYFKDVLVSSTKNKFGKGITDEELIPKVGASQSTLITRDFNIKRTRLQYELCQQHKIGVFFLTLPKDQNKHWEIVKTLIHHWEFIIEKVTNERRPFAFRLKSSGGKPEKM